MDLYGAGLIGLIAVFIFGGGYFLVALVGFWIDTLVQNHRIRVRNRAILANEWHRFVEHF